MGASGCGGGRAASVHMSGKTTRSAETQSEKRNNIKNAQSARWAKETFDRIEDEFQAYKNLKLTGSSKEVAKTIKEATHGLKTLETRYRQIMIFRAQEWNIAALYRVGRLYQLFAQKLYASPIPSGLSESGETSTG